MNFVKKALAILGLDQAVGYGVFTRIWGIFGGMVNIIIITKCFTSTEQGYFYTISGLLALQIFFELGLLVVVAQFASHEFALLSWGPNGKIVGDEGSRGRLMNLLAKATIWYGISSAAIVIMIIPIGLIFFNHSKVHEIIISWEIPWILSVFMIAANLLLIPFYAVISGSGDVVSVNKRQLIGGLLGSLMSWCIILNHGGLYAVPALSAGNIIVGVIYLFKNKPILIHSLATEFRSIREKTSVNSISWRNEIWPMQWRIAISWIAGYFIFQLFTPVIFIYHGPIMAGQMGVTISISNALMAVSIAWVQAKSPEFGRRVAMKNWKGLDALFLIILKQTFFVVATGAVIISVAIYFLQRYSVWGTRFLPYGEVAIMLGAVICIVIGATFAAYLRAHKTEPMLKISIIVGILTGISTITLGRYYSTLGVCLGHFIISLIYGLPMTYIVWKKFRHEMHDYKESDNLQMVPE